MYYDICITSPPYYNLEIYCDEENQSINKFTDYKRWLENFIEPNRLRLPLFRSILEKYYN